MDFHVGAARGVGMNLSGIAASINSTKVAAFAVKHNIPNVWSNPLDLIDSDTWDAMLIAIRTEATLPLLERAMARNLPVLVEKPVALSPHAISDILIQQSRVMVAYNRRYYPKFQEIKKILDTSEPVMMSVEIPEKLDFSSGNPSAPFTGVRLNSVHVFDLIRFLVGPIEILNIQSIASTKGRAGTFATLRSDSGHLVSIKMNYQASANFKLEIDHGSRRYAFCPLEQFEIFEGMKVTEPTKIIPIRNYEPVSLIRERSDPSEIRFKPGFFGQAQEFKQIINGDCSGNYATLLDARKALELAEALTVETS